jgi:hypothetical protein
MVMTPTTADELKSKLNEGTVQFAFKKLDGTLRTAVGTTSLESIPLENHPTTGVASSPASIRYFDMGKNAWRSVSATAEIFLAD